MTDVAANLAKVRDRVQKALGAAGRKADEAQLIAVSKTYGPEAIRPAIEAGQKVFGENRVQEARGKWPALKGEYSGVELHLIGPLQSNKAREAVELFDAIHTIDREKIAREVAKEMARQGKVLKLFIQVNTGREPQKAGIAPEKAVAFTRFCRAELGLPIAGLMCIPPVDEDPAPHFDLLAGLAREAAVSGLSMGMSGDFEQALALGATAVRVGSAIFGARDYG